MEPVPEPPNKHSRGLLNQRLDGIERQLDRIEERLKKALGEGEPAKLVHTKEGMFSPGSGFIPYVQPAREPRASPETAYEALKAARAALKPKDPNLGITGNGD